MKKAVPEIWDGFSFDEIRSNNARINKHQASAKLHLKEDSVRKCCRMAFSEQRKLLEEKYGSKY